MTEWVVTRSITLKDIKCDLCGKQADTLHFLPWVAGPRPCEEVKFACKDHDPGGYWLDLTGREGWFTKPEHWAEHIGQKVEGWQALAALDERFHEIKRQLAERDAK